MRPVPFRLFISYHYWSAGELQEQMKLGLAYKRAQEAIAITHFSNEIRRQSFCSKFPRLLVLIPIDPPPGLGFNAHNNNDAR